MRLCDSFKESGLSFDKVRTPTQTLEWVIERFSSMSVPVLMEVKRVDKGRLGIPVYVSRYSPEAAAVTGTMKQMGKGVTEAQAKASAVMEIAERYSFFRFLQDASLDVASCGETGEDGFPPEHLLKAIHLKERLGDTESQLLHEFPIGWAEGLDAMLNVPCRVPFSWMWPIFEYNGSAAGNSLEEAAVQAICEVVERHVCSLITYGRIRTPTIDQQSIRDGLLVELIERFKANGVELLLKDFSLGTGIPTVGAIAWDPSTYPDRSEIVYTAGTSTSPERAAIRAITEIAQLAGDFDTDGKYIESGLPKFATLEEADYVVKSGAVTRLAELPDCSSRNFRGEVELLAGALGRADLPVYIAEVTCRDLCIPVVYAMIPGSHFRNRTLGIDLPFHMARVAASGGYLAPASASGVLERLKAAYPGRFEIEFYMGHLLESMGDISSALKRYQAALSLSPPDSELASLYCNLGNCLRQLGRLEDAAKQLEIARGLDPRLKEIHNILGTCLYEMGRYTDAIECFEKVISIDPGSAVDYANIGSNLRKLGLIPAAIKWYRMALEIDPSIEWAREHLKALQGQG